MTLLGIITIFVVVANISLGLFVLLKGVRRKVNIYFFFLSFVVSAWVGSSYYSNISSDCQLALITGRAAFVSASLIVPLFIYFVLHFPKEKKVPIKKNFILSVLPIFFCCLSLTSLVFKESVQNAIGGLNGSVYGSWYPFYCMYILLYFFIGFYYFFQTYKSALPIEKLKLRYVIAGFAISAIGGVFTNLIWPLFISSLDVRPSLFGPLCTIFMTAGMSYAILRYRLLDIKLAFRKGFVHFIALLIILFLYIYLLIIFQRLLIEQYAWQEQTATIILVLIIVTSVEPLRRVLVTMIDRVFYARKKSAQEEAHKLRIVLSSSVQFDQLIKKVILLLADFLEVQDIQFIWLNKRNGKLENYYKEDKRIELEPTDSVFQYLREHLGVLITEEIPYRADEEENGEKQLLLDAEATLQKLGVSMVLPIGEKGELIGAFTFGRKKKNEAYTSDNVEYLSRLQFQMTNAIANALLYKQAVERIGTRH